jgi:hypothetical protein
VWYGAHESSAPQVGARVTAAAVTACIPHQTGPLAAGHHACASRSPVATSCSLLPLSDSIGRCCGSPGTSGFPHQLAWQLLQLNPSSTSLAPAPALISGNSLSLLLLLVLLLLVPTASAGLLAVTPGVLPVTALLAQPSTHRTVSPAATCLRSLAAIPFSSEQTQAYTPLHAVKRQRYRVFQLVLRLGQSV